VTETISILNNAKSARDFGDAAVGTCFTVYPGCTSEIPRALFEATLEAQTMGGNYLRAMLKAGTLTVIDNPSESIEAVTAQIKLSRKEDELAAIACRDGRPEVRARLSHRRWSLLAKNETRVETRYLFDVGPLNREKYEPTDDEHGWRCFAHGFMQRPRDETLAVLKKQSDAQRAQENQMAAIAQFAIAGAAATAAKAAR
jgi:hypothetical protein